MLIVSIRQLALYHNPDILKSGNKVHKKRKKRNKMKKVSEIIDVALIFLMVCDVNGTGKEWKKQGNLIHQDNAPHLGVFAQIMQTLKV